MSARRVIWKYNINTLGKFRVDMPAGAKPLHVEVQTPGQCAQMWVLCDPDAPLVRHRFCVYGTGHDRAVEDWVGSYVGTWLEPPYVWHLFYEGEVNECQ